MNIAALKAELASGHPLTGTYNSDDALAADELNAVNRTRDRTSMTGRQVAAKIVNSAYDALSAEKKIQILSLIASDDIDPFGFAANVVQDIFGSGSATVLALIGARVESISRAVERKLGTIKHGHVQMARTS